MTLTFNPVGPSSNIAALAYDPETETLGVRFATGGEYHYAKVPPEVYRDLQQAEHPGRAFHTLIRGGGYTHRKIEAE